MIRVDYSADAMQVVNYLKDKPSKETRMLLKAITRTEEQLRLNPQFGDSIKKKLIPEVYKEQYHVKNLFRVPLPMFWRMIYTLHKEEGQIEIISFIIDIITHKEYNKKFGY